MDISIEKAKSLLDGGIAEAQELIRDPSKVDDLLGQMEEKLRDVPAVGETLSDVTLMISMVKAWITREYSEVSPKVIATLVGAFLYLIRKKDIIPDNIPVVGIGDDLVVLGLALKLCEPELTAYKEFRDGKRQTAAAEDMAEIQETSDTQEVKRSTGMNEVIKAMKERRSIRKFKADMVPKEQIEAVVEAGLYAASGMGKQSAMIVAVTEKELRDQISEDNRKIGGWQEGFDPFYGAPVILIVLGNKEVPTHVYDGSLVMGNLMLAAHSLGLGSIWIHRAKEEFETDCYKDLLKKLGVEGEWEGIGHCALGYADGDLPQAAPRKENRVAWAE